MQSSDNPPSYSSLVVPCDREKPPAYSASEPPPPFHISAHPDRYHPVRSFPNQNATRAFSQNPHSPTAPPTQYIIMASDNLVLTMVMMAMCAIFLNVLAFPFLVPALVYSKKAAAANSELNHMQARKLSQRSLWLNIAAVISFIVLVIVGVILGIVLIFTFNDKL